MPIDYSQYPSDWSAVRHEILRRAGGRPDDPRIGARCEHCGVRNYTVGYRDQVGEFQRCQYATSYRIAREAADLLNKQDKTGRRHIVIVLTIAHLQDPDPANVSPDNLAALCQGCHNRLDREMRRVHANQTRYERRLTAGQLELQL